MALYVVIHKICDNLDDGYGYCNPCHKKIGHTYICGEESEVKKLVDDLNNKSFLTRFPLTEKRENEIISKISSLRSEIENPNSTLSSEDKLSLKDKISSLYLDLNDESSNYNYWDYELVHFLDASSARAFLL